MEADDKAIQKLTIFLFVFLLFVNEEVNLFIKDYAVKIATLKSSIEEKRERRRKLYNTIETGALNYSDVAPRIKELNDEVDLLTAEIQEIESQKTQQDPIVLSDEELRPYVLDLGGHSEAFWGEAFWEHNT